MPKPCHGLHEDLSVESGPCRGLSRKTLAPEVEFLMSRLTVWVNSEAWDRVPAGLSSCRTKPQPV